MPNEHPVMAVDQARRALCLAADADGLDALLADNLVYVHTSGLDDTKKTFIDRIRSGDLTYHRIEPGEVTVRDHGVVVCVSGHVHIEVTSSGTFKDLRARFVQEWVQRDGRWQLEYWQSTIDQAATPR